MNVANRTTDTATPEHPYKTNDKMSEIRQEVK